VDAGAPKPDGSIVAPALDATVTPTPDTGVGTSDAGGDAAASMDGALEGDGAVGDSAIGDGGVGDSAVGDGATGDGAVGDSSVGDGGTPDAEAHGDLGKGNGSDVVLIGDSWMSNGIELQLLGTGGGIAPALQRVSGQRYRNYAIQGVKLLEANPLFGPAIPTQWDDAVKANPNIKTVVMSAGGNDIIQGTTAIQNACRDGTPACEEFLLKIGDALGQMWLKMVNAGVRDIVYILYAKSATGGRLKDPDNNNARLKLLCDHVPAPARCFVVNTDALAPSTSNLVDGIHPNSATNTKIANAILDLMTKQGMRR
jgi:lysophospholipase L1-like esterase